MGLKFESLLMRVKMSIIGAHLHEPVRIYRKAEQRHLVVLYSRKLILQYMNKFMLKSLYKLYIAI